MILNLKQYRKSKGFTQHQLAEKAGVHRSVIAKIEASVSVPTVGTLVRLSRALNVTLNEMVSLQDQDSK